MGLLDGLPGARPAPPEADKLCSDAVPWREVWEEPEAYSGKTVAVTGTVAGAAFAPGIEGKPTFLNIGNPHPRTPRFELSAGPGRKTVHLQLRRYRVAEGARLETRSEVLSDSIVLR